jgi:hypothetical protein
MLWILSIESSRILLVSAFKRFLRTIIQKNKNALKSGTPAANKPPGPPYSPVNSGFEIRHKKECGKATQCI